MEFSSKQHHHDHVTRGSHQHNPKPLYPHIEVMSSHNPYVEVTPRQSHVEVRTPSRIHNSYQHSHHHNHHSYSSSGRGGRVLFVGLFILLPIVVVAAILSSTLSAMSLTTASLTTAGAGATGAMAFSAATFGIGALVLYGALGLAYLYSSAKECYSSDKNVFDMIKSRVVNDDGLSFKGVMKSIGSVLWSPFLLLGGLSGMAVKAAMSARVSPRSVSTTVVSMEITESYKEMGANGLGSQPSMSSQRKDLPPVHTELYSKTREESEEHHLLDSQVSFPLYPSIYSSNN
ncbi:hypothetical protein [Legionella parisiensis]|uniref:Transmembrane protein n=1 Tax=Legionella parisiensis TaxID=45071 RepID=A0A1E5JP75_9GAMM|nr:hypothetical protein [Legionella parisiensis]KTD41983.1 transmembrane protein [Legionella parisiensis]OEH46347.1 hypothetical protein lpari_02686 [Legionella parisiensis]STX75583.1 transmembrane protein [Legionella parisiensis]